MFKGFIRLAVVAALLTSIVTVVLIWKDVDKYTWQLEKHISPYLRGQMSNTVPSGLSWPVFAATSKFLALSNSEKVDTASDFYERNVRQDELRYFVGHNDAFKKWFLATANLSLNDAPIEYFDHEYGKVPFRNFMAPTINIAPRMSYVLFSKHSLVMSTISASVATVLLLLIIFLFRWIYSGHIKKDKQ